ncbi:MAG: polysulfide reductase [Elusimicrobia bacterium GWA2_69_24]|nr:MAG: polysulfide reductase [Elusimicrobia bacterium GWA2_69_24]HBL17308.1 polysulfide reductase [Elusimicrobiota bacterium]
MNDSYLETLRAALAQVSGFIYPNELELQWSILIVLYPYITGLVAGAFILASLERVFNVKSVKPTYRLSLLVALAFLLIAPLPLQVHLGHPERAFEIFMTPNTSSAMAMFGFVYIWYLMVVLLVEIWLDYRREIVLWSKSETFWPKRLFYKLLTFGVDNISPRSLEIDEKIGRALTVIGLPSAVLLHGYVGFIFGSIKANPWWSTPLMPIIFLFSAMASGIAGVLLFYMFLCWLRDEPIDMPCIDTVAKFFLTALIVAFSLEMLETLQTAYEAEEHFDIIALLVEGKLYFSMIFVQILMGSLTPMFLLGLAQLFDLPEKVRKVFYGASAVLSLVGIFAMRWNVVVGGQFFSKSLRGFTTYKMEFAGREGLLSAIVLAILPLFVLAGLLYLLPPWGERAGKESATS